MATNIKTTFNIAEAALYAGLSLSMVDYLCRTRILVPTATKTRGRGRKRLYSFGDIVMLRVIAKLLAHGIEVARLRVGLRALRSVHPEITPTSLPDGLLCTDGRTVYIRKGPDVLEDLARGQYAFAFVLELNQVREEVMATIRPKNRRKELATGT